MFQRVLTRLVLEQRHGHIGAIIPSDADEQDDEYLMRFDRGEFMLFNREKLSKQTIKKSMEEEFINPNAIIRLILDFFLKTGMHEEALSFAEEVGIDLANSHSYHVFKVVERLEDLLETRQIDQLIAELNDFDPRILAYNRLLNIQLLLFKVDEIEVANSPGSATWLIHNHVLPIIEASTDREEREKLTLVVEKSVGGMLFQRRLPATESDVMDTIRKSLYEKSNLGTNPKIEQLIETSLAIQEVLRECCELKLLDECELFRIKNELKEP